MRVIYLAVTALVCVFSSVSLVAQSPINPNCNRGWMPAPAYVACLDSELGSLADEMQALYRRSLSLLKGQDKTSLEAEQRAWEGKLAARCGLWNIPDVQNALAARPCLGRQYVGRIAVLGRNAIPSEERLLGRSAAGRQQLYFTVLSMHDDPIGAINALSRLRFEFPYEAVDLYSPRGPSARWLVVFASYVDRSHAAEARDLSRALAMSPLPELWQVPDPLVRDTEWLPCKPSGSDAGVIVCNGKTYDNRLTDKATASAYLSDRLSDQPSKITTDSSYFTIVRSAATQGQAHRQLNALMSGFPAIQFALYPPFAEKGNWEIMIASFTDQGQASKAVDLAKWLGMGPDVRIWQLPEPFKVPEEWRPEGLRQIVIHCLAQDARTILEMYACSGSVVTPALLQICIKRGVCELSLGTLTAASYLSSQKLSWNSPLNVQAALPDQTKVTKCVTDQKNDEKGYVDCVLDIVTNGTAISSCGTKKGDSELAKCLLEAASLRGDQIDCLVKARRGDAAACVDLSGTQGWVEAK
jgi:uncharacterized protein YecT (DUF1311 family)